MGSKKKHTAFGVMYGSRLIREASSIAKDRKDCSGHTPSQHSEPNARAKTQAGNASKCQLGIADTTQKQSSKSVAGQGSRLSLRLLASKLLSWHVTVAINTILPAATGFQAQCRLNAVVSLILRCL